MRDPKEWDEQYILSLPVGEFDWIEFKGRRALDLTLPTVNEHHVRQNLSRELSAFANSGGGVIVFGIKDPQTELAVDDGGIALFVKGSSATREWLEDIIPHLLDLPLSDFNVYVITKESDSSQISAEGGLFIVDIRDSELAPHQATDNKYYVRVGSKSQPAGHKLVTDIANRAIHPKIDLGFRIKVTREYKRPLPFGMDLQLGEHQEKGQRKTYERAALIISAKNVGRILARFVNCFVRIPESFFDKAYLDIYRSDGSMVDIDGTIYVEMTFTNTRQDVLEYGSGIDGSAKYGPSWFDPILPGLSHDWDRQFRLDGGFDPSTYSNLRIYWQTYADNAPANTGETIATDLEVTVEDKTKLL